MIRDKKDLMQVAEQTLRSGQDEWEKMAKMALLFLEVFVDARDGILAIAKTLSSKAASPPPYPFGQRGGT